MKKKNDKKVLKFDTAILSMALSGKGQIHSHRAFGKDSIYHTSMCGHLWTQPGQLVVIFILRSWIILYYCKRRSVAVKKNYFANSIGLEVKKMKIKETGLSVLSTKTSKIRTQLDVCWFRQMQYQDILTRPRPRSSLRLGLQILLYSISSQVHIKVLFLLFLRHI